LAFNFVVTIILILDTGKLNNVALTAVVDLSCQLWAFFGWC